MKTLTGTKLISCFLPLNMAAPVIHGLKEEMGIFTADYSTGRGIGTSKSVSLGMWDEIAILTVIVDEARADDVFTYIFEKGEIDHPKGGLIYMRSLSKSTPYILPDIPDEPEEAR